MSKIVVTMWITLDGFIVDSAGKLDWILGDDELSEYELNVMQNADIMIFGAKTYKDFAGYWPNVPDNPDAMDWEKIHAKNMNKAKKIVFSKTITAPKWDNTTVLNGINGEEIQNLKNESTSSLLIYGSASIVQQLTNLGLIDEYQLLVHPVALGSGKPLFENLKSRLNLALIETKKFNSGVICSTYHPKT